MLNLLVNIVLTDEIEVALSVGTQFSTNRVYRVLVSNATSPKLVLTSSAGKFHQLAQKIRS